MLYHVNIVARSIQVTADTPEEAAKYAEEDTREFYADWGYIVDGVRPAYKGEDLTTAEDDIDFEVDEVADDDDLYTFDATFSLVVEADTPEEAGDKAKFFYKQDKYGPITFDEERGPKAIAKIMEHASSDQLQAGDAMQMVSEAYNALVEIPSTDPGHDILERVFAKEQRWGGYTPEDAKEILAIAGEFEPQGATPSI